MGTACVSMSTGSFLKRRRKASYLGIAVQATGPRVWRGAGWEELRQEGPGLVSDSFDLTLALPLAGCAVFSGV